LNAAYINLINILLSLIIDYLIKKQIIFITLIMVKKIFLLIFLVKLSCIFSQQLPFWTQHRSNYLLLNPAVSGYKKTLESRVVYRNQWTGFDGAPKTLNVSAHTKFRSEKIGAGFYFYQDKIGIQQINSFAGSFAYHVLYEDLKLSFGVNASYNQNNIDVTNVTYVNSHDVILNNIMQYSSASQINAAAGFIVHNEKFYCGIAVNNLVKSAFKFRETPESKLSTDLSAVKHYNLAVGYNWLDNPDFIWENSLMINYVPNIPLLIDYNLKLYMMDAFYVGIGARIKTAVYAQLGYTISNAIQIGYSYDYNTNILRNTNSGSHELKLVYILDNGKGIGRRESSFHHRKFQYLM
jgi:type IX secretion system PorP/SprF family membrane protein